MFKPLTRSSLVYFFIFLFLLIFIPVRPTTPPSSAQTVTEFKFPWPSGKWEYRQGWHDPGNVALDIGTRGTDADKRVLAATDGVITKVCTGVKSANIEINHGGTTLEYWHFDVTKLAPGIAANQPVVRGQVLGTLLSGPWTKAADGGGNGCGEAPEQLPDSAHLHWIIRASTFTADGWTIQQPSSTWTSGSQSVNPRACDTCPYDFLPSTNVPSAPLSVQKAGDGTGQVSSNPAGIDCGADCANGYPLGTSVTLSAAPASGSTLAAWSGACTGSALTCTVTVDAIKSVTATFNRQAQPTTFNLLATRMGTGSGTVTGTGINCGSDCAESYTSGTVVTLQAAPTTGSLFSGWGGACTGTGNCVVSMNADKTVSATFNRQTTGGASLTVSKAGKGTGWVTSNPAGINCGLDCTENYSGTTVTLTAYPDTDSWFDGWSGDCTGKEGCTVTVTSQKNVTANFGSGAPLGPPQNVKARLLSTISVEVKWDYEWVHDDAIDADEIRVERLRPGASNTWDFVENGYNSNYIVDNTVRAGKTYVYRAIARRYNWNTREWEESKESQSNSIRIPDCTYAVAASGETRVAAGGGTGALNLEASPGCDWRVSTNVDWIWVSPGGAQGSRGISFGVQPNCAPVARAGQISIGASAEVTGNPIAITQAPNRTFSVGQYSPSSTYNIVSGKWFTGDLNGDGRGDLLHLTDSDYVHPWLSQGDGTFDVRQFRPWPGYNIRSGTWLPGDFNGDQKLDLVHVTDADFVNVWLSIGDGNFSVNAWSPAPRYNNRSGRWLAGDLNADGATDLIHLPQAAYMHPWISQRNGTFDVKKFTPPGGRYSVNSGRYLAGDFTGDRKVDLVHMTDAGYIHEWISEGNGRFNVANRYLPWPGYNVFMGQWLTGDINGDGRTDLVHVTGSDYIHIWFGQERGNFSVTFFRPMSAYNTSSGRWLAADIDGDGKTDLVHIVADSYVHPWMSRGDGTFALSTFCPAPKYNNSSGWWVAADFNGDRKSDMVHLVQNNYVHPWTSGADTATYSNALSVPGVAPCPGCPVMPNAKVWANTRTGRYHCQGTRYYGKTSQGTHMTQKQAQDAGFRPAYRRICQ